MLLLIAALVQELASGVVGRGGEDGIGKAEEGTEDRFISFFSM
jgi:hypothetical protein